VSAPSLAPYLLTDHGQRKGDGIVGWTERGAHRIALVLADGHAFRVYWPRAEACRCAVEEALWALGMPNARTTWRARGRWARLDAATLVAAMDERGTVAE
jgi:hypothetical protein